MIRKHSIAKSNSELPDPDQYPDSVIVIYDGRCKFCTAGVNRLKWLDGKHRLSFMSLHDERIKTLCPDLSHDELMKQMYVITRDGNRFGGASAIRYLSRRLPKLWILVPLMHIPFSMPFWHWAYNQVAKRRYKLGQIKDPCDDGTCSIHFDK